MISSLSQENSVDGPDDTITLILNICAVEGDSIAEVVLSEDVCRDNEQDVVRKCLPRAHTSEVESLQTVSATDDAYRRP